MHRRLTLPPARLSAFWAVHKKGIHTLDCTLNGAALAAVKPCTALGSDAAMADEPVATPSALHTQACRVETHKVALTAVGMLSV